MLPTSLPIPVFIPAASAAAINKPRDQTMPRRAVKGVGKTRDQRMAGIRKQRWRTPVEGIRGRRRRHLSSRDILDLKQSLVAEEEIQEEQPEQEDTLTYPSTGMLRGQMPAPTPRYLEDNRTYRTTL